MRKAWHLDGEIVDLIGEAGDGIDRVVAVSARPVTTSRAGAVRATIRNAIRCFLFGTTLPEAMCRRQNRFQCGFKGE